MNRTYFDLFDLEDYCKFNNLTMTIHYGAGSPRFLLEITKEGSPMYTGEVEMPLSQYTYDSIIKDLDYKLGTPHQTTDESPENTTLNSLSRDIHQSNVDAGWWTDLATGQPKDRNVGELLCLVHSEISEAMEGYRKGLQDDKLPHRTMFEVELADALIRIFDIAGKFNLDLDGAVSEKREYNKKREDHKLDNRKLNGGKKF